ncbi:MAG: DNA/RNA helicase domain-containing protein [Ideonella sp.]|nr:DNA/RNA helicase domain-containing protein [Ideonella sp.]
MHLALQAEQRKQVVIVRGGPGTGKSLVALNLMRQPAATRAA